MKKKISIILLGLMTAIVALAQDRDKLQESYPDSLELKTDNGVDMVISFDRMSERKEYVSNTLWKSILNIMETAVNRNEESEGIQVLYQTITKDGEEQAQVKISSFENSESTFIISNDGTKEYLASRIEFYIVLPKVMFSFTLNNMSELASIRELNLESVWSQIDSKYNDHGKVNLYSGTGEFKYGEAFINQIKARKPKLDNLEITLLGIGIGYYRDRFVPDLGSKLSVHMYNRLGQDWMEFGVMYNQQYFFTRGANEGDGFNLDINGFLTGFWKIKSPAGNEFGVGISGLIHREGDFYEGSTWKLSLYNSGADSRFTYSPELIFTNDFKSIFPAIRFGMSF